MDEAGHQKQPICHSDGGAEDEATDELEAAELVIFHVKECYVYLIPPRKTAASYRADEWNVNQWHWEGALKVISKGVECIIRLEDKNTGELFARAFLRKGEPHPVEPVIDSSRYFVLRVEENIGGRVRHAFIGIGFRERPQAYDFQAALHDHMKYLNKKQTAEKMEQHYQTTSSVDYSLKEGETLILHIKNKGSGRAKSALFERLTSLSLDEKSNVKEGEGTISLKPPPPPPSSPVSPIQSPSFSSATSNLSRSPSSSIHGSTEFQVPLHEYESYPDKEPPSDAEAGTSDGAEQDDFGDFQAAA